MEEKPSSANFVLDRKPSSQDVTSNLPAKSTLKAASGEQNRNFYVLFYIYVCNDLNFITNLLNVS